MNHDVICSKLEKRLNKLGCYTWLNEEYRFNGQSGECDVIGVNFSNKRIYIVEVKETDSPKHYNKAMQQLLKDKSYYANLFKDLKGLTMYSFYAYSKNKRRGYNVEEIKDYKAYNE